MSVDRTNTTHKKARRRRTIKNAIVNIDASTESGPENINWRRIAKKKLMDRELGIMYKRQQIADKLITAAIRQFVHDNVNSVDFSACIDIYNDKIRQKLINPQSAIMSLCAQSIANILKNWKGYTPVKKKIPLFRDYFTSSRHWFDSKKVRAMAIHFWIPSMQLIREFAMCAAARLFPNSESVFRTLFAEFLNVTVLRSVFEGKIKFPNAGIMWLIPARCFKVFLERYNHRLRINVTQQSNDNQVLRSEFVQCINSKHDELKSAVNQFIASSTTHTRKPASDESTNTASNYSASHESPWRQPPINRTQSILPSYALHQNYPLQDTSTQHQNYPLDPVSEPFGAMEHTYTSLVPIQQNHDYVGNPPPMNPWSFDQMNHNQSTLSSYPVHQNYPLYSAAEPEPSDVMTHTYTSHVPIQQNHDYVCNPPPMNPRSFDQMNHDQSTLSSYPVDRNYPATYTPNAPFQHTNTGATTNPFGPMRRSSYDASVPNWSPCAYCCQCCCCRSFRK